jgi:hypothetical protein
MSQTYRRPVKMSEAKKSHKVDGARRRPKKQIAEQSPQIPSKDLNLLQTLSAPLDAELLSRIECLQRLAQEVDEYYEYKLLAGEGKQAKKRCAEYMRAQNQILSHLVEGTNELMCRARVRNDILLMTQMQTADPQARVLEETKSTRPGGQDTVKSAQPNEVSDTVLRNIMSTFIEKVKLSDVKVKASDET